MKLSKYLKLHGLTHKEFADMVGVSRPTITIILNGHKNPSPLLTKTIQEITKGEVSFDDLFSLKAPSRFKGRKSKNGKNKE